MIARLTLICHAATAATRTGAFPGDEPLEPQGAAAAAGCAGRIRGGPSVLTSPALRARQTADALGLSASIDQELRDCDYGRWAGRSLAQVEADEPEALAAWITDPRSAAHDGESLEELLARVSSWLDERCDAGTRIVAVTHASVVRAAIVHALRAASHSFWLIDIDPLTRTELRGNGARWTLRAIERLA